MVLMFAGCGSSSESSEPAEPEADASSAVYYDEIAALPTMDSTVEGISQTGRSQSMSSSSSSVSVGGGIGSSYESEVSASGSVTVDGEEVSSYSESSGSSGVSSESSSSSIAVSYSYKLEAASKDDAETLLQKYYDCVTEAGMTVEEQEDGSVVVKNGDTSLAAITLEENDSSYSAKLVMMTMDQSFVDQAMEELNSDDEEGDEE